MEKGFQEINRNKGDLSLLVRYADDGKCPGPSLCAGFGRVCGRAALLPPPLPRAPARADTDELTIDADARNAMLTLVKEDLTNTAPS